jgi:hypothetical protein
VSRLPAHTCGACGEEYRGPAPGLAVRHWLTLFCRELWRWDPEDLEAMHEAIAVELARRRPPAMNAGLAFLLTRNYDGALARQHAHDLMVRAD